MIRSLRLWIIGLLVLVVVVATAAGWISRHTSPSDQVLTPTLLILTQQPDVYVGERVLVTGDVRVFEPGTAGEYYVLEEAGQYRVAIHGLSLATLRPLTNRKMTIEGVFRYKDGVGRYIDVAGWSIPPATPSARRPVWPLANIPLSRIMEA